MTFFSKNYWTNRGFCERIEAKYDVIFLTKYFTIITY